MPPAAEIEARTTTLSQWWETYSAVRPAWAIEGGRITIQGTGFPVDRPQLPIVRIADARARVVYASPSELGVIVLALERLHHHLDAAVVTRRLQN